MARPLKQTVDYFPHYVNHGKTLLIIENEYGNTGYAFWFKVIELLCTSAVIITSDGDFDELVKMLLRKEKLRMVFAPCRNGCSKLLRKVAVDKIGFIDDLRTALEKV